MQGLLGDYSSDSDDQSTPSDPPLDVHMSEISPTTAFVRQQSLDQLQLSSPDESTKPNRKRKATDKRRDSSGLSMPPPPDFSGLQPKLETLADYDLAPAEEEFVEIAGPSKRPKTTSNRILLTPMQVRTNKSNISTEDLEAVGFSRHSVLRAQSSTAKRP